MRSLILYQPHTLEEAATILVECLEEEERKMLGQVDEDEAVLMTHLGIGIAIRESWIYGARGEALRASQDFTPGVSGSGIPEDQISAAIVARAWQLLRQEP